MTSHMSNLSILDLIKVYIGFMKASTFILFFEKRPISWPNGLHFILNGDHKHLQVSANRVPRLQGYKTHKLQASALSQSSSTAKHHPTSLLKQREGDSNSLPFRKTLTSRVQYLCFLIAKRSSFNTPATTSKPTLLMPSHSFSLRLLSILK